MLGVCLTVGDIRASYAELTKRGVIFDEPPEVQPWGGTLAHFKDPDGNVLTLVGHPAPDRRAVEPDAEKPTCGQELAASADVPDKLGRLWAHVATNLEAHAKWVGNASPEAAREHAALVALAAEYRTIARAATRAAAIMTSMKDLPAAPHDPSLRDPAGQAAWMREKVQLQSDLAALLLDHAQTSQKALGQLEAKPGT
jgi:hypothetical protein